MGNSRSTPYATLKHSQHVWTARASATWLWSDHMHLVPQSAQCLVISLESNHRQERRSVSKGHLEIQKIWEILEILEIHLESLEIHVVSALPALLSHLLLHLLCMAVTWWEILHPHLPSAASHPWCWRFWKTDHYHLHFQELLGPRWKLHSHNNCRCVLCESSGQGLAVVALSWELLVKQEALRSQKENLAVVCSDLGFVLQALDWVRRDRRTSPYHPPTTFTSCDLQQVEPNSEQKLRRLSPLSHNVS